MSIFFLRWLSPALLLFCGFGSLPIASVAGDQFSLQADVTVERIRLAHGASAPPMFDDGQRSRAKFILQPDSVMPDPPDAQPGGRGWSRALVRTTFSTPLNLMFEGGMVTSPMAC